MIQTTRSPEETHALGNAVAPFLRPGDLLLLTGDLGTGKTTFVQGLVAGLGGRAPVTSPSFILVQEYALPQGIFRHVDVYRLPDPTIDLDRIGLPELLEDPHAITVVEWADRLPTEVFRGDGSGPRRTFRVRLAHGQTENERTLDMKEG